MLKSEMTTEIYFNISKTLLGDKHLFALHDFFMFHVGILLFIFAKNSQFFQVLSYTIQLYQELFFSKCFQILLLLLLLLLIYYPSKTEKTKCIKEKERKAQKFKYTSTANIIK